MFAGGRGWVTSVDTMSYRTLGTTGIVCEQPPGRDLGDHRGTNVNPNEVGWPNPALEPAARRR
jgi:hypothetical protein